jgi:hypothetical protein
VGFAGAVDAWEARMLNLLVRCLLRGKVLQMDCLSSENLKEVGTYSSSLTLR